MFALRPDGSSSRHRAPINTHEMARASLVCILAGVCVALGGCGGGTSGTDAQVRQLVPAATSIRCAHRADTTRCDVLAGKAPGGLEAWTCEFTVEDADGPASYGGTETCWTEHGRPESLRMGSD
jgi:hypothetical protein